MASVIYPHGTLINLNPHSVHKILTPFKNVHACFPNGYIIAKGNRFEGITAET